jgi:hypothetical protein
MVPARGGRAGPRSCAPPAPCRLASARRSRRPHGRPLPPCAAAAAAAPAGGGAGAAKPGGAGGAGHGELRALATDAHALAPPEAPPAPPAFSPDDVLRTIRLLERRESDLRDEMKDLLTLMASSAQALQHTAPALPPQLARDHIQRLERCGGRIGQHGARGGAAHGSRVP